ncbi:MAG: DUF3048 domain-containing protein [Actinomycetota bacterium]|nr:DUF3048 domain-containing protein [Actinomycetota bacterium]
MSKRHTIVAALAIAAMLSAACSHSSSQPAAGPSASPTHSAPPPTCPLTGVAPKSPSLLKRPAVAVKVENNPSAYPLSGLEKADLVFEEVVEGGLTRFMALFDCGDASSVGPVRSSRIVDPAIMIPATKILADAGGNGIVLEHLQKKGIVNIDEDSAGSAMHRESRPGYAFEHTLYGNTAALRKLGEKGYKKPPPQGYFDFGPALSGGKKAHTVTLDFGPANTITYSYKKGRYYRTDGSTPLVSATNGNKQISVDNVIVEFHKVDLSTHLADIRGTPSPLIEDFTGSNKAVLFRGGKAYVGKWKRSFVGHPVKFVTKSGDEMTLATGTTWIELLPDKSGQVNGSLSFSKK